MKRSEVYYNSNGNTVLKIYKKRGGEEYKVNSIININKALY